MSERDAGSWFTSLVISIICVYITFNAHQMWAWASGLQLWEVPAKILLIAAFIEGGLFVLLVAALILIAIFKLAIAMVNAVTP